MVLLELVFINWTLSQLLSKGFVLMTSEWLHLVETSLGSEVRVKSYDLPKS